MWREANVSKFSSSLYSLEEETLILESFVDAGLQPDDGDVEALARQIRRLDILLERIVRKGASGSYLR